MNDVRKMGRVTIPTDTDAVSETLNLLKRWGGCHPRLRRHRVSAGAEGHRRKDLRHLLHYP